MGLTLLPQQPISSIVRAPGRVAFVTTTSSTASFPRQVPCLIFLSPLCSSPTAVGRSLGVPSSTGLKIHRTLPVSAADTTFTASSSASKGENYTVGDFMTTKDDLRVVTPSTTVDEALEKLVENKITGFPVVDDDWNLVGVVSDYDLLALDSISGSGRTDGSMFPEVDRTWKVFNEIQRLLSKTNGKVIGDVMTQVPVAVRETTNLEDAARMLLETRYRRLPVVDAAGKLVGIITRGNVIRAALEIKRDYESATR